MYTRNRSNQGYANTRSQSNPNPGYQGQGNYNQQGGGGSQGGTFQGSQPPQNQQNYKQGGAQNSQPFKQQQQQPQPVIPRKPQQMQQQQSQQQMKQAQQPVPNPPQQQSQPQLQSQPQPPQPPQPEPRLKPILKHPSQPMTAVQNSPVSSSQPPLIPPPPCPVTANSNSTPTTSNNMNDITLDVQMSDNTDAEIQEQIPRWRRKAPGFRVNKRLKRLRLNQRLRKTLQPKNAIMVLNEMKPGVQFTFPETQGPMPNSLYLVHAELDGKTYVGQGLSKPLARQNAAENALKALLLEKMTTASMKARIDAESEGQANQSIESVQKDGMSDDGSTPMDTSSDESDEIPWSSLASFALYKLFLEWHNQGTSVPVPRPGLPSPVKGLKREITQVPKAPIQKELPPNAINIHPVMLLNQMRPGLTYVELNRVGNPPNTMFTLAVDIDGVEYTGTAKNKKDAKKIAAKSALQALYNLIYPIEIKTDSQDE